MLPFLGLVRDDVFGDADGVPRPAASTSRRVQVRRATGTHYTPPSLTEPIVQYALEPVVYRGPAEGSPREEWELKRPSELLELKVCDIAMGSAAFLVAACRYLAARLVEAWERHPGRDAGGRRRRSRGARADRAPARRRALPLRRRRQPARGRDREGLALADDAAARPAVHVPRPRAALRRLAARADEPRPARGAHAEAGGGGQRSCSSRRARRSAPRSTRCAQVRERIEATDAVDLREAEQKATALARR